jgi:hypothetical protein
VLWGCCRGPGALASPNDLLEDDPGQCCLPVAVCGCACTCVHRVCCSAAERVQRVRLPAHGWLLRAVCACTYWAGAACRGRGCPMPAALLTTLLGRYSSVYALGSWV